MKLFIFFCDLLIPLAMVAGGWMMLNHPPKKVNGCYGYRTPRSMKSPESWNFANKYCGKLWFYIGITLLPLSALAHLPFVNCENGVFGWLSCVLVVIQGIFMVGVIYPVERELKKKFD